MYEVIYYKMFLRVSQKSYKNTCAGVTFGLQLWKVTPAQVSSCEFCKNLKKTYFVKHLATTASDCLWCNKVLPYTCSVEIWWRNLIKKLILLKHQKQPARGVLKLRCSENMQQIYRRTPKPKIDFNKVALQL